jgi:superfamily II DNA or RNA helicase
MMLPAGPNLPPLDPHQVRFVAEVKRAYQAGARHIVGTMATGAGKTRSGVEVVDGAIRKGRRIIWKVRREELLDQAAASLAKLGVPHGVIKAGRPSNPTAPIQVVSEQTIVGLDEQIPADGMISDECHHDTCETSVAVVRRWPLLEFRIGLTATPERGDGQPLSTCGYQALVVGPQVADLQRALRNGHPILVPMDVKGPRRYQKELFREPVQGLLEFGRAPSGRLRPTIYFAESVTECERIAEHAKAYNIRAAAVHGKTKGRDRIFAALAAGELDLVTNVFVATEGWDCPRVEIVAIGRGCATEGTFLQMAGRGLRASPETGKRSARLIDYRGVTHLHGLVHERRQFSIDGKAISRTEKLALRQCDSCGSVFEPADVCPSCGAELPRALRRQKVKQADAATLDESNVVPIAKRREFFEMLKREQMAKGYKPQWVGVRYQARFGSWPPWSVYAPLPGKGAAA